MLSSRFHIAGGELRRRNRAIRVWIAVGEHAGVVLEEMKEVDEVLIRAARTSRDPPINILLAKHVGAMEYDNIMSENHRFERSERDGG